MADSRATYYAVCSAAVSQMQYFSMLLAPNARGWVLVCADPRCTCEPLLYGNAIRDLLVGIYLFMLSASTAACPLVGQWVTDGILRAYSSCLESIAKLHYFGVPIASNKERFIMLALLIIIIILIIVFPLIALPNQKNVDKIKQVLFCMAIKKVELSHECFPKQLYMGTARIKEDKETDENK